jgi:hypothetical protein
MANPTMQRRAPMKKNGRLANAGWRAKAGGPDFSAVLPEQCIPIVSWFVINER